jgi:hypothetical protein
MRDGGKGLMGRDKSHFEIIINLLLGKWGEGMRGLACELGDVKTFVAREMQQR